MHRAERPGHHLRDVEHAHAVERRGTVIADGMSNAYHSFETDGPLAIADLQPSRSAQRDDLGDVRSAGRARAIASTRDEAIRVLVLRGAGGKAFVAGTDIAQFQNFSDREDGLKYEERLDRVLDRLERVTKPTIAQVQGVAAGGGCAIALTCDLRVATPEATFGIPIARTLGNCLSGASYSRLRRRDRPGARERHAVHRPADRRRRSACARPRQSPRRRRRDRADRARARRGDRRQCAVDDARDKGNDPACPGEAPPRGRRRRRHGRDVLHERRLPRRRDGVSREAQADLVRK